MKKVVGVFVRFRAPLLGPLTDGILTASLVDLGNWRRTGRGVFIGWNLDPALWPP
jgi:hypothetical protein